MIKKIRGIIFFSLSVISTIISISLLFIVLGTIFTRGLPAISLEFLTSESTGFGQSGGILYQLIGTVLLVSVAGILALPIAVGSAVYQTEFLSSARQKTANILVYALNAVPTIVFGLFGYIFFGVFLNMGISWLSGSFILAIMILPTLIVSIKEAMESIPLKYKEAGLALGFTRERLISTIIIPHSLYGMVTGLLLGLARALGETAAIMFTATTFSGILLPSSLGDPVTTLQTHILVLTQEAIDPKTLTNAWGTALILVVLVMLMSLVSMIIRIKLTPEAQR